VFRRPAVRRRQEELLPVVHPQLGHSHLVALDGLLASVTRKPVGERLERVSHPRTRMGQHLQQRINKSVSDRHTAAGCVRKPRWVFPAAMPSCTSHTSVTSSRPLLLPRNIYNTRQTLFFSLLCVELFAVTEQTDRRTDARPLHTRNLLDAASGSNI